MKVELTEEMKGKDAPDENSARVWPTRMVNGKFFNLNVASNGGFSTLPIGNGEFIVIPAGFEYEPAEETPAAPVVNEPSFKRVETRSAPVKSEGSNE